MNARWHVRYYHVVDIVRIILRVDRCKYKVVNDVFFIFMILKCSPPRNINIRFSLYSHWLVWTHKVGFKHEYVAALLPSVILWIQMLSMRLRSSWFYRGYYCPCSHLSWPCRFRPRIHENISLYYMHSDVFNRFKS